MSTPMYSKGTQALQKSLATEYALSYCRKKGLATDKLLKQRFDVIDNHAIFSQPSGVKPNGLTNDMATMPFPTLIITCDADGLHIETTEYTEKYLK